MKEAFIIWITGPPASGKSTLTRALLEELRREQPAVVLESDRLREILTPDATYTRRDRDDFYRILGELAILISSQGINVLVDATAHRRKYRDWVRARSPRFVEVAVSCPQAECEARDPKGIYRLARQGRIKHLPGFQVDYEEPLEPEFVYHSDRETTSAAVARLLRYLIRHHLVEGTCLEYMSNK